MISLGGVPFDVSSIYKLDMVKKNKYGNNQFVFEDMKFASKLEWKRYMILREAEKEGKITNLRCQVEFLLLPNMYKHVVVRLKTKSKLVDKLVQRKVIYTADFVYEKNGETVVEDCKGSTSSKFASRDFPLRKKMMYFFHGKEIRIVSKATEEI